MGKMDYYSRFQIYDFGRLWEVLSGIGNLRFGRFDLAKQPEITAGSGASPESLESDLIAVRTTAQCSSPARLVQSVRDDTREREIELAG